MKGRRQNNKGVSLVELIVVISIMAVLTGMVSVGAGILVGRAAKETRDMLLTSLENVRAQTMGKDAISVELSYTDNKYVLTYTYNKTTAAKGTETVTESKVIGTEKCIMRTAVFREPLQRLLIVRACSGAARLPRGIRCGFPLTAAPVH
jgi:prepilin-type N-terminal cleavage/methylation domain-containing protein